MSEYWVSKKQYWCKYCNIWIRDDAPSRSLHESGLKHQGNKERYIREIYRGGERAKREKDANARAFARIEAAAKAAHAKDTGVYSGRPAPDAFASSSSAPRTRPKASGDKLSNYSSAAQLGFDDEDTKLSSYEIEQMVRGRGTSVGKWEEVKEAPVLTYGEDGLPSVAPPLPVDEEDHENFKFSHKDKRPIRDVYDDDEWDPAALTGIKLKTKERKIGDAVEEAGAEEWGGKGKEKAGWSKIGAGDEVKEEIKEEITEEVKKEEIKEEITEEVKKDANTADAVVMEKTPVTSAVEVKAEIDVKPEPPSGGSLFKKRRPPPSSRKK